MKILFLGSGGGRINVVKQFRSTAGFVIDGSKKIYVDPGPGAIFQAKKFRFNLEKIDILYLSHPHLDHVNDAEVVIEAMTHSTLRQRGILIADKAVLEGSRIGERFLTLFSELVSNLTPLKFEYKTFEPSVSSYHKRLLKKVYSISAGEEINVENVKIKGTKTKHDGPGTGFVLDMDGKRIGYTADTEYFDGLAEQFFGCDVIIINILRVTKPWSGHFYPDTVIKFLKISRPKKALLTRFGGQYLRTSPNVIAKKIQDATGIEVMATYDGFSVEV